MAKLFKDLEIHVIKSIMGGAILGVCSLVIFYFSITTSDAQQTAAIEGIQTDISIIKAKVNTIEKEPTKIKVETLEKEVAYLRKTQDEHHKEVVRILLEIKSK